MEELHQFNILLHVAAGTVALVLGLTALLAAKRAGLHTRTGRYFLMALTLVVATALTGSLLFRSSPFLFFLTLLSGYVGYSGFRAVRLRERQSRPGDALIAGAVLAVALWYTLLIRQGFSNWSPVIIYSTVGAIILVTTYDLVKYFFLHQILKSWWIYEHIYKLISAFSAIVSAFAGTVLPNWQPYSQLTPSVIGILLIFWHWYWWIGKKPGRAGIDAPV